MDALSVFDADTDAIELSFRGTKRKAESTVGPGAKRGRGNETPTDCGLLKTGAYNGKY